MTKHNEEIVSEVLDTLFEAKGAILGLTALDTELEIKIKCQQNECATTRRIDRAISSIQQLEGSNPWHKASEELPKMTHFTTDGDYSDLCVCINESGEHNILVLCENSDYTYWAYGYDGEGLYDEEIDGGEITHWMPIPEIKED